MSIDPAYRWILDTGRPFFSWQTTEFDYSKSVSARNWWIPGGYKGGSTSYLTNRSNRYVGNLHTSTDHVNEPSLAALELIDDISPVLATLIDVWQEPRSLLRNLKSCEYPLFIDFDGKIHHIPGCRSSDWHDFNELVRLAVRIGGNSNSVDVLGQRIPTICWWVRDDDIYQIQFKRCDRGWLVIRKLSQLPYGLTVRQAEVCSLSAMGLTSFQIAAVLQLSARTIDRHIENVFDKTLINNRIELACVAASAGLIKLSDFVSYINTKGNNKATV
jgi:DNA-binding CsgD family transcriptional regulator